jgi:hypothetical protein
VAAGDHEHHRRQGQGAVVEDVGVDVGDQVVDPEQGPVKGQGVGLGRRHPDQQRPGQAGADGDRHRVHVGQPGPAEGAGLLDRRMQQVDMGPRGHLGDHAAVAGVQGLLVGEHVGADQPAVGDQGDAGLVAGGLDPEHQHGYSSRGSGMRAARPASRSA